MTTAYRRIRHLASALVNRENVAQMREYESFADALRDSDSYEDRRIIDVVAEKTRRYRDELASSDSRRIESRQTVQNLFVLSVIEPQRRINVIEVGGACGASYYEVNHFLPHRIERWSISETAAMASAGDTLNDDTVLSFHSDIDSALKPVTSRDLMIIQGTLQYVPDPLQLLADISQRDINHVYVTRTAVTNLSVPIITKQETEVAAHGPGKLPNTPAGTASQPMTLLTQQSLFSALSRGYEIILQFAESEERELLIDDRAVTVRDVGFLARKRVYSHT